MPRRSILPLAVVLLALAPAGASAAGAGTTFLTGGLDLPAGAIAGGESGRSGDEIDRTAVSADGRYVAFASQVDTFDPAAQPDVANVFRKDLLTGEVLLVSRATGAAGAAPAATSDLPAISDDGSRVAFRTTAALDPGDTDGGRADVYVRDVGAATTTLASRGEGTRQALGFVSDFDLSGDGAFVAFATDDALAGAFDVNGVSDVYRWDLASARLALVSASERALAAGNAASFDPAISDDGTWVAYVSSATDLTSAAYVPRAGSQIFARDVEAGDGYLVSASSSGAGTGSNGSAMEPDLAGAPARGRPEQAIVAYTSQARDLDAADADVAFGVYRRVLAPGTPRSTLVSRADGAGGANADARSYWPAISDDGLVVTFTSEALNLGLGQGNPFTAFGAYARDVASGATVAVSADNLTAGASAVADDGRSFAWYEEGGPTPDSDPDLGGVFGRTYASPPALGPIRFVSRPAGSAPFLATWVHVDEPGAGARTISADGRYVVVTAFTSRLPGGSRDHAQVYRRDTLTGAIDLVSRATGAAGAPATRSSGEPRISGDGTRVAFLSSSPLDPAHGDGSDQLYVRDLVAGTTTLASRGDGPLGVLPDDDAVDPAISADGKHVAFATAATNLGVPGGGQHVFARNLAAGETRLVDRATGPAGAAGDDNGELPSLSADGRLVAFGSQAGNLDPDDPDRTSDAYVRDMSTDVTTLVSRRAGPAGQKATGPTWYPALSADGKVVAFQTADEELAPEAGPWGGTRQVVARTLATGANVLVSRAPGGGPVADADSAEPTVSGDGAVVAFESDATNLLPGVGGRSRGGVFARTLGSGALAGPPAFGILDNSPPSRASSASISDDGQCLAFTAIGHNAASGIAGDVMTSYVHVASGRCPKPLAAPVPRRAARGAPRPALTRASLLRKRFRVGRAATARTARGAARASARRGRARRVRRAPAGTAFRFTLNTQARVTIVLERPAEGRLVGRFCRRPARRLRRNLRCVRFVEVGRLVRTGVRAGRSSVAFSGRVGRRALRAGTYRARLRAANGAGVSRWARLGFRVVRR